MNDERTRIEEMLRMNDRRWRLAQKVAGIGNWEYDVESDQIWGSEEAFHIYRIPYDKEKYPDQQLPLQDVERLFPDVERIHQAMFDLVTKEEQCELEYKLVSREGSDAPVIRVIAELERDASGKPVKIHGTVQDVSAGKQADEELRKFRTITDNAAHGNAITDLEGNLTYINDYFARVHGYTPEELIGKNLAIFHNEDQIDEVRRLNQELIQRGSYNAVEVWHARKDGSVFPMLMSGIIVFDDEHNPMYLAASAIDITDQKRADELLRQSEERYRIINDASFDYIYSFDPDGRFTSANRSLCRALNLSEEEIIGKTNAELGFPQDQCDLWDEFQKQVFNTNATVKRQTSTPMPDGTVHYFDVDLNPLRDRKGNIIGISGSTRDITERVLAEDEKTRVEEQLRQSQKMESIGRLAGGVAHDFNNLLTSICGNLELVTMDLAPDDPIMETLNEIEKAADSAASLTRQLLAFSRKQLIQPRIVDLNEIVGRMLNMLRRIIGEDVKLIVEANATLSTIMADPGQIEQVIINLTVNARDAMRDGGTLILETSEITYDEDVSPEKGHVHPGDYVMLTISDDGEGMDEETRRQIYEPFFTTKKGEGTGLGLSTVYGIVKQHDGYIDVYSELRHGTTFKAYFPLAKDESLAAPKPVATAQTDLPVGDEIVLVVEDEPIVRNVAVKILRRQGYTVFCAGSGTEALLVAKSLNRIDLLLTDVVMPNINGRELAEELSTRSDEMKVLFTSGYTEKIIANHGVIDEGLQFIGKPYTPHSLARKVRSVLDS